MASQVLSGVSNPSYTNTTGENVRIIINYMRNVTTISWSGVSVSDAQSTIGRNLAFINVGESTNISANNLGTDIDGLSGRASYPTEVMLAPGETFSATCGAYNIVVIPEGG